MKLGFWPLVLLLSTFHSSQARADIQADQAYVLIQGWTESSFMGGRDPERHAQIIFLNHGAVTARYPVRVAGLSAGLTVEFGLDSAGLIAMVRLGNLQNKTPRAILGRYWGGQFALSIPDLGGGRTEGAKNFSGVNATVDQQVSGGSGGGFDLAIHTLAIWADPDRTASRWDEPIAWQPSTAKLKVEDIFQREYLRCGLYTGSVLSIRAGALWKSPIGDFWHHETRNAELKLLPQDPAQPNRYVFESIAGWDRARITVDVSDVRSPNTLFDPDTPYYARVELDWPNATHDPKPRMRADCEVNSAIRQLPSILERP
jgi:hypothetical protein